jgi:hypothetical protein
MGGGRSRKTHSSRKSGQINKRVTRSKWLARHVDQVWEDIRKPAAEVHQPGVKGPMGTTAKYVQHCCHYLAGCWLLKKGWQGQQLFTPGSCMLVVLCAVLSWMRMCLGMASTTASLAHDTSRQQQLW